MTEQEKNIRKHFFKIWQTARDELIKAVKDFNDKDFKTNEGGERDKDNEFYKKHFPKLKKAVDNYERVYQLHRITDKVLK